MLLFFGKGVTLRISCFAVVAVLAWSAVLVQGQASSEPEHGNPQASTSSQVLPAASSTLTISIPDSKTLELVKSVRAGYPEEAIANQMQGEVRLKLFINEVGDVLEAQVLEGDDVFKKPAADAAMKWKFKPFIRNGKPIQVSTVIKIDFAITGHTKDSKDPDPGKPLDPSHDPGSSNSSKGATRVRVSPGVAQGMLLHKVQPTYPPQARMNHIQGTVVLDAIIGKNGEIDDLKLISGPPDLVQAAMGAVRQWRYKPYYLNGEPIEVDTHITINFALAGF